MHELIANTKTYNQNMSPIILEDLSEYSGIHLAKKIQPSSLTIYDNKIYVGTKNSRIFIYTFDGDTFTNQQKIVVNYKIIYQITITHLYFVLTPQTIEHSSVSIWDKKTNRFQIALKGHKSQISSVIFLYKNGYMATSSWDSTIKIWFLQETFSFQDPIKQFINEDFSIITMKLYTKQILVFGDDDCFVKFWNWERQQIIDKVLGHGGSVTYIHSCQHFLLTGGGDHIFKIMQKIQKTQNKNLQSQTIHKTKFIQKKKQQQILLKQQQQKQQCQKKQYQKQYQKQQQKQQQKLQKQQQQLSSFQQILQKKNNLKFQTIKQIKYEYDSKLFDVLLENKVLIMDYQGRIFLYDKKNSKTETALLQAKNPFLYNQNIVGIAKYNNFLIVVTTKSVIKLFSYSFKVIDQNQLK